MAGEVESRGGGTEREAVRKRDSSPRAILPIRVGRKRERRAKSPGWRQGANQRGCYSPPRDLFKGLRLRGREQTLEAAVVPAGSPSWRRPLRRSQCLRAWRCCLHSSGPLGQGRGVCCLVTGLQAKGLPRRLWPWRRGPPCLVPGGSAGWGIEVQGVQPGSHCGRVEGSPKERGPMCPQGSVSLPSPASLGLFSFAWCLSLACAAEAAAVGRLGWSGCQGRTGTRESRGG